MNLKYDLNLISRIQSFNYLIIYNMSEPGQPKVQMSSMPATISLSEVALAGVVSSSVSGIAAGNTKKDQKGAHNIKNNNVSNTTVISNNTNCFSSNDDARSCAQCFQLILNLCPNSQTCHCCHNCSHCNCHHCDCIHNCHNCHNCTDCNCHGCDCHGCDCHGCDCHSCDCSGCDCNGCDCSGCDCSGCDCSGCDCSGCDCSGFDCNGCNIF